MNKCTIFFLLFFVFLSKTKLVKSVIERQIIYQDDDFKSFTNFFASSPSANFLTRIVHTTDSRFIQLQNTSSIWMNTIDKASAINQVSNVIMRSFISLLLLILMPYFIYLGIYGNTKNQLTLTLTSIWGYFCLLIGFYLTNGIFNIGLVCSMSLVFGFFMFYIANSDFTTKSLYTNIRYISCFILSKFLYDIGTNLKGDFLNNLDYGLSGVLYIDLFKGNNYFVLKLIHLLLLSLLTILIVKLFPKLFSPSTLQSPLSIKLDKFLISFLCALPIAAGITQVYFLLNNSLNPIDPSIFFMIPSSINFLSMNTIFALITWILTTIGLHFFSEQVEKDFNHVLNKIPNKITEFL